MFRTIQVRLTGNTEPLLRTAMLYREACQIALDYGFENKSCDKNRVDDGTYKKIRKQIPQLNSALVQCARDQACELLKCEKLLRLPRKKRLQIRYDRRTFKFYPDSGLVSLSTVMGRLSFPIKVYDYCKRYLCAKYTNAQLIVRKGAVFLNIQCKLADVKLITGKNRVLGIDRGVLNIVTCSDNTFANSIHLRNVKGKYRYLRAKLQSLGTASARRKLQRISGAERRFVLDVNHVVSKRLVQKPYDAFAIEALRIRGRKANGKRFNKLLGSWSYGKLLRFLKYKSEAHGKRVIEVSPNCTSQRCSNCAYVDRRNRRGMKFKCLRCGFQLNADLNAARNIALLGTSELSRLQVNEPIVTPLAVTSHSALAFGG